jgi:hypothetical protein
VGKGSSSCHGEQRLPWGAGAVTKFHVDSGFATWHDLAEGVKLWAVCNLADGVRLRLHENPPISLGTLAAPAHAARTLTQSARLARTEPVPRCVRSQLSLVGARRRRAPMC